MRTLIDGYNLMHALGRMGRKFRPDEFHRVRRRFLDDLAALLGPMDAVETTVVFDAAHPPAEFPSRTSYKGITVLFAVDQESADDQIMDLIAHHSAPKGLTVVSTDLRIRQAATRRKARALSADEFWSHLEARGRRPSWAPGPPAERPEPTLSPAEAAYWLKEFRELADAPELKEALGAAPPGLLTDEEIAAIEREVEREPE